MDGDESLKDKRPIETEEPRDSEADARRAVYDRLAGRNHLIQEVSSGFTTFREALDEIVYEFGHPGENSEGMAQFMEYVDAMAALTGEPVVDSKARWDIINYQVGNSKEIKGLVKKVLVGGAGGSTASLIAGFIVKNEWARLILQSVGASGLTTTGCVGLYFGTKQGLCSIRARKHFKPLYKIADTLDVEVADLYKKGG